MTALTAPVEEKTPVPAPRILVFSTNNISDPGIDLAGSAHLHYSPGVRVISSDMTMALMHTLLPEPVVPAMSMWGMVARSATIAPPLASLPITAPVTTSPSSPGSPAPPRC